MSEPKAEEKSDQLPPNAGEQQSPEFIKAAALHNFSQQIPQMLDAAKSYFKEKETTQRRMHYATVSLCALIVVAACVIGWCGNSDSAERIILPLITFLGGLLVGERSKGFFG